MRTPTRVRFIAPLTLGLLSFALAAPASAASWGSLTAYYKSQVRSVSSGTFYDDRATYATVKAYINDPSNDGNNAYTDADEYFFEPAYDCGRDSTGNSLTCWSYDRTKQGPEYSYFNTPATFFMYNSLHVQGSSARASIHTCAQLGWPVPDACSPRAVVSFSY